MVITLKNLLKSMSPTTRIPTTSTIDNNCNSNLDNNEVLVYENGTVLGSVILIENITNISNDDISTIASSSLSINSNKNCLNSIQNCDIVQQNLNNNCTMNNSYSINENSISIDENNCCSSSNHINRRTCNTSEITDSDNNNCRILNEIAINEIENNQQNNNYNQTELLNSSICSHESRQSKQRSKLKLSTSKKSQQHQDEHQHDLYTSRYPPQYTAIYLDANNSSVGGGGGAGVTTNASEILISDSLNQIQQSASVNGRLGLAVPVVHSRNAIVDSGQRHHSGIFRKWFRRPSLPFVVGILALGGVACTLGGIVLGSTGLVEHSTQYLSAALLMIGIGVSLLVISGAIWRLTIPDENDNNCPCFRHLETTCRNCNSPFCGNRIIQAGFMYPEFQHRPPPPSYLTSLNECTVGLLLHHEVPTLQRNDTIRLATPPPAYRSSNSLSVFVPLHNLHPHPPDQQETNSSETIVQIPIEVMSTANNPNNLKETPSRVEI